MNDLQAQGKEGEVAGIVSLLEERAPPEGSRSTRVMETRSATSLELGDGEKDTDGEPEGGPVGPLCSRNAHDKAAVVQRPELEYKQGRVFERRGVDKH